MIVLAPNGPETDLITRLKKTGHLKGSNDTVTGDQTSRTHQAGTLPLSDEASSRTGSENS